MKPVLALLAATALASCATAPAGPIIDRSGVNPAQYQRDYSECQQYQAQVGAGNAGRDALTGAIVGGLLGDLAGANRDRSAGLGIVAGGAAAWEEAESRKVQVFANCMINRGYKILG